MEAISKQAVDGIAAQFIQTEIVDQKLVAGMDHRVGCLTVMKVLNR